MQVRTNVSAQDDGEFQAGALTIQQVAAALKAGGLSRLKLTVMEQAAITNALEAFGGNRTQAAHSLGIAVRTLQRKIKSRPRGEQTTTVTSPVDRAAAIWANRDQICVRNGDSARAASSLFGQGK